MLVIAARKKVTKNVRNSEKSKNNENGENKEKDKYLRINLA